MTTATAFRSIFGWLMGYVALIWVWTVALMIAWPSDQTSKWEPDYRVLAVCADKEPCSVPYGELAEARAKGRFTSLVPPEPVGEVVESDAWLRWKTVTGKPWQYEVTRSSWHFQTTVRYRLEGDTPVLSEVNHYDAKVMLYAFPLAFFTLVGLAFRGRR